ncbi:MAG TPA: Grx4 family monothiol glutaredoxin [Gammaproteobacteria bacterium]|jgi:monothiol glutaredoxin|nr:Grx4 family monothiol glutaredoxin [Gammaproteobacteria bacterium]MDP6732978.1 Grx4 family monothiol glutaredoxin [Gammaproteobacteria bacterium]HAJ76760.1 Grx4 family monothiol glutaredoxin [Gammaproteobacteria bacterium]|tara:strand:+ start:575 stop:934 length:360 start_codon:yes stop_codon:yes gene_type:complete
MSEEGTTEQTIKDQIESNSILLYMKGNPEQPMCGFSAQTTQVLMACGKRFAYVDILGNPEIRATLPKVSNWPTFPQLYINGEFVGGCDIVTEMYEKGELQPMVEAAGGESENPESEVEG